MMELIYIEMNDLMIESLVWFQRNKTVEIIFIDPDVRHNHDISLQKVALLPRVIK